MSALQYHHVAQSRACSGLGSAEVAEEVVFFALQPMRLMLIASLGSCHAYEPMLCTPFEYIQNPAIQELASVAHPALAMQHMLAVHVGQ